MLVYLRDGSAQTILRAATLRKKLQIQLSTSPSHSILTPDRPVPALTLYRQAPGRVAHWSANFKSLVWFDPEKFRRKRDSNSGPSAPEVDASIARPTRQCLLRWYGIFPISMEGLTRWALFLCPYCSEENSTRTEYVQQQATYSSKVTKRLFIR